MHLISIIHRIYVSFTLKKCINLQAEEELVKLQNEARENKVDLSSCTKKVKEVAKKADDLSNDIAIHKAKQMTKATKHIEPFKSKVEDVIKVFNGFLNASHKCVSDSKASSVRQIACLVGVRTINYAIHYIYVNIQNNNCFFSLC